MRSIQRLAARVVPSSVLPSLPRATRRPTLWTLLRRARDILILVALITVARWLSRFEIFQSGRIQEVIQSLGATAPAAFISLCVLASVAYVPAALPIGLGSIAFGHARGGAFSLVGISLGACAAYLLGRYAATGFVTRLLGRRAEVISAWVTRANTFPRVVGLRLIVFCDPTFNYLTGATRRIDPRAYVLGTFFGLIPRTLMISYFFDLFMKSSLRDVLTNPLVLAFPLVRVSGVVLLAVLLRRPAREADSRVSRDT